MDNEKKGIGTISIGNDITGEVEREIALVEAVRSVYKDHRMCTVARSEENTFVLSIENPESSGRCTLAAMHLTEDSMLSLVVAVMAYYTHRGIDMNEKLATVFTDKDGIGYEYITAEKEQK